MKVVLVLLAVLVGVCLGFLVGFYGRSSSRPQTIQVFCKDLTWMQDSPMQVCK